MARCWAVILLFLVADTGEMHLKHKYFAMSPSGNHPRKPSFRKSDLYSEEHNVTFKIVTLVQKEYSYFPVDSTNAVVQNTNDRCNLAF